MIRKWQKGQPPLRGLTPRTGNRPRYLHPGTKEEETQ